MKDKQEHLNTLLEFYQHILNQGHNFWYCAAQDEEKKRPYFYVQIHRMVGMATCNNCCTLIDLKKRIIKLQKELGIEAWPLRYKFIDDQETKVSVNNSSPFNPTFRYLASKAG